MNKYRIPNLYEDQHLVRVTRAVLGMTQMAFGRLFEVRAFTVSRWERGHVSLPAKHRRKMVRLLREVSQEIKRFLAQQSNSIKD